MKRDNKERLYNVINKIGPWYSDNIHIMLNNGPEATHNSFLVHLTGGIFFELIKDDDGIYFDCKWKGPLPEGEPVDILAWMMILQFIID